jgi:hypothetical protein
MYKIKPEYYFRLHQVRPRFKNDIENVLLYVSKKISELEPSLPNKFNKKLFNAIRLFPGNATKADKTIDNWRTEISALFGLVIESKGENLCIPGKIAKKLSDSEDLVEFFKYFLFYFQYPGGHIKTHKLKEVVDEKIRFKPVKYILKVLETGEKISGNRFQINKAEATHFIYNDLRVTRDNCDPIEVVERIIRNRQDSVELDWKGDVIRYAGDILDYMVIGDLLTKHGNNYFVNWNIRETITAFIDSKIWFNGYDKFYGQDFVASELLQIETDWFSFINNDLDNELFKTDVLDYLGIESDDYLPLIKNAISDLETKVGDTSAFKNTKEIGDLGEHLIIGHESMRMKLADKEELIHLIKKIPTHLGVGYDIQSVEIDSQKRYIEVKTTISNQPLNFNHFHLTTNEWNVAQTLENHYYIYRLMINKTGNKLFLIKNPVNKFKRNLLKFSLRKEGVEITFNQKSGEYEELLIWKS